MAYDNNSHLWSNKDEAFYRNHFITPIKQKGPHCLSTVLAMLHGHVDPTVIQNQVNTQDPVSWSKYLMASSNMKLAYCPTDARKLKYYINELIQLDDLFTLSYYTCTYEILDDPNEQGWVTGSHIVILHRDQIIDPQTGEACNAISHSCLDQHTKRIFRVLPAHHERGI